MSKSSYFTGQPIFSQLLYYISHARINSIANKHHSDRYYKDFKTYEHLVTMLYGVFNRCCSIREVVTGLQAWEHRVIHLGMNYHPRKSTISDANTKRGAEVFEAIYYDLYFKYRHFLPDSRSPKMASRTYIADSTTISLFQEILKNAGNKSVNGKRKGGIKVHTLIKSDEDVPCLIRFTAGAAADNPFLKNISLAPGSILIIDRGYSNDYKQLSRLTAQKITWVTRLRKNTVYRVLKNKPISNKHKKQGILKDQVVEIGHTYYKSNIRLKARLIELYDKEKNEVLTFLTNSLHFASTTIAGFYRKRWQIELLFKRIKQNYPLSSFLGDTENAIKVQIWCVLIADLILKIIKSGAGKKWAFSNLASMIRIHLMTYINLNSFLKNPEKALAHYKNKHVQISLFPT